MITKHFFMLKQRTIAGYAIPGINEGYKIVPNTHQFTSGCLNLRFIKP
jgi:hypothetical protein